MESKIEEDNTPTPKQNYCTRRFFYNLKKHQQLVVQQVCKQFEAKGNIVRIDKENPYFLSSKR